MPSGARTLTGEGTWVLKRNLYTSDEIHPRAHGPRPPPRLLHDWSVSGETAIMNPVIHCRCSRCRAHYGGQKFTGADDLPARRRQVSIKSIRSSARLIITGNEFSEPGRWHEGNQPRPTSLVPCGRNPSDAQPTSCPQTNALSLALRVSGGALDAPLRRCVSNSDRISGCRVAPLQSTM